MSRRHGLVALGWVFLPLIAFGPLACSPGKGLSAAEQRQIEAVIEPQRQAWNRGDLPAYMEGYARTPRLTFTSGGKIRRGWDETLAAYQKRYGGNRAGMGQLAFEVLDVAPVGAGAAVVLGRWRLRDTPAAGSGVFSVVLEQRPEGWRIVHDQTSVDAPSD
jgi:ketosteroid isomerase-like protein